MSAILAAPSLRWLRFLPVVVMLLGAAGCGKRDPQVLGDREYEAASGAWATLHAVLGNKDTLAMIAPEMAQLLGYVEGNLSTALQVPKAQQQTPEIVGTPLVDPRLLAIAPAEALAVAASAAQGRNDAAEQEQTAPWWEGVVTWGGWPILAGLALWAARLANVPGVNLLTDPVVRAIGRPWLSKIEAKEALITEKAQVLRNTVEGSLVGRAALQLLDQHAGNTLAPMIQKISDGKASTVDGLFKLAAKNHAIDSPHIDAPKVQEAVDEVRNTMPTNGGNPSVKL